MTSRRKFLAALLPLIGVPVSRIPASTLDVESERWESAFQTALAQIQSNPDMVESNHIDRSDSDALARIGNLAPQSGRSLPSTRPISDRALSLIIASEVGGETLYTSSYQSPQIPGVSSGVTIGIGYDLGYANPSWFQQDWSPYLNTVEIERLKKYCRKRASELTALPSNVSNIRIPWSNARRQFIEIEVPLCVGALETSLENCDLLSKNSLGALASLAYNRGTRGFTLAPEVDQDGRFIEMRTIRDLMKQRRFKAIAQHISSMTRLWEQVPRARGLVIRRKAEAALFELGLRIEE